MTTDGAVATPTVTVRSIKLDDQIPAVEARQQQGALDCALTAFRAPAFPVGLDVLTVTVTETAGHETPCRLGLELPPNVRIGANTVVQDGRPVITLPATLKVTQQTRDWGYQDDAVSLPGWAKPAVACDPAFRNIQTGLGALAPPDRLDDGQVTRRRREGVACLALAACRTSTVRRAVRIVHTKQSSTSSKGGQNATVSNVY